MILPLLLAAAAPAASAPPPAAIITTAPQAAPAPGKPPSAAALKLVEAVQLEARMDAAFRKLVPLMGIQVTTTLEANPATRAYASQLFAKVPGGRARVADLMSEEFQKELRKQYPELKRAIAQAYDAMFTPQEMDELIRFFGSGVGAKYMASTERLQQETEAVSTKLGERAGIAAAPVALQRAEREAGLKPSGRTS
ncbi:MAG TPA: DUF2059 domain-containing protein [Allosphingosinicella sp.]|jgi:hypothetical protein